MPLSSDEYRGLSLAIKTGVGLIIIGAGAIVGTALFVVWEVAQALVAAL